MEPTSIAPSPVNAPELFEATGLSVPTLPGASLHLIVDGMTCGNCARAVTQALESVPGVSAATADPATGRCVVRFHPGAPPLTSQLLEGVDRAGYSARLPDSDSQNPDVKAHSPWKWAIQLGVPVTLLLMLAEWGFGWGMQKSYHWVAFFFALPVQVAVGAQFYLGAWRQARVGAATMDTLVALGSSAAFGFSVWGLLAQHPGHLYFMEAAAILSLVSVGHWLEARMSQQAASTLRGLIELAPSEARRMTASGEIMVPVDSLVPGQSIVLKPGDRVPVDATVIEGQSTFDEAMLTGEANPVQKSAGADIFAGTLNQTGQVVARVTAVGETTALAQIVAAVRRAQSSRAHIQRLADQISRVFVPVVICLATVTALAWGFGFEAMTNLHAQFTPWLWNVAVPDSPAAAAWVGLASVLIVACPCAMGLATPVALMAGLNAAARRGILIRDALALEKSGNITMVIFDKTGTLTEGCPGLVDRADFCHPETFPPARWLAARIAGPSLHPLSRALVAAAPRTKVGEANLPLPLDWRENRGRGVEGHLPDVSTQSIRLGSPDWLAEMGIDLSASDSFRAKAARDGSSVLCLAVGSQLVGIFALRDSIKPGARDLIAHLRSRGFGVRLLTGDQSTAATSFGSLVGLLPNEISSGIRPEAKAEAIQALQRTGARVAFIGDGLNDGPALAQADLGIAVARATDVARDAADIVLLRTDLQAIPLALDLARATLTVIRQNLFWAFFYNAAAIPLAMLGFLSPVVCALAMGLSDVVVVGNALRLRRR